MSVSADVTIVLAMRTAGNARVMRQALDSLGYTITAISTETALQAALAKTPSPRLGVVDITDLGAGVWPICACLRDHNMPFIVLSTPQARKLGNRLFAYGAACVLDKPVAKSALLELILALLAQRSVGSRQVQTPAAATALPGKITRYRTLLGSSVTRTAMRNALREDNRP